MTLVSNFTSSDLLRQVTKVNLLKFEVTGIVTVNSFGDRTTGAHGSDEDGPEAPVRGPVRPEQGCQRETRERGPAGGRRHEHVAPGKDPSVSLLTPNLLVVDTFFNLFSFQNF